MSAAAKSEARVPADEPVIEISRVYDAPRELVWECFTDAKHLQHWWGPNGFSITNHSIDVRDGGRWDFVMHGPDGRDWDSIITYTEVKKPERLVYQHGEPGEPPLFVSTVTFAREGARRTRVTLHARFPSIATRNDQIRDVHAAEGGKQTLDRLADYIATQQG
jgi:uncharacterized protein YndB with AHSA1/START domain